MQGYDNTETAVVRTPWLTLLATALLLAGCKDAAAEKKRPDADREAAGRAAD